MTLKVSTTLHQEVALILRRRRIHRQGAHLGGGDKEVVLVGAERERQQILQKI